MNIIPLNQYAPKMRGVSLAAACAAALTLIGVAPAARAQAPTGPQSGVNAQLKKDLQITPAQEAKIKALQSTYIGQMKGIQQQAVSIRQQVQQEQEAVLTPAQRQKMKDIQAKFQKRMQALQQQAMALQTKANKDMESVLTPAQQAKIKQIQATQMQQMGGPRPQ